MERAEASGSAGVLPMAGAWPRLPGPLGRERLAAEEGPLGAVEGDVGAPAGTPKPAGELETSSSRQWGTRQVC